MEATPNVNEVEHVAAIGVTEVEVAETIGVTEAKVADVDLQILAIISSPDETYARKMFDIMDEASLCYNDYAIRKGFSIRIRTSRRSAITKFL